MPSLTLEAAQDVGPDGDAARTAQEKREKSQAVGGGTPPFENLGHADVKSV